MISVKRMTTKIKKVAYLKLLQIHVRLHMMMILNEDKRGQDEFDKDSFDEDRPNYCDEKTR